jgi:hypothetical protein
LRRKYSHLSSNTLIFHPRNGVILLSSQSRCA